MKKFKKLIFVSASFLVLNLLINNIGAMTYISYQDETTKEDRQKIKRTLFDKGQTEIQPGFKFTISIKKTKDSTIAIVDEVIKYVKKFFKNYFNIENTRKKSKLTSEDLDYLFKNYTIRENNGRYLLEFFVFLKRKNEETLYMLKNFYKNVLSDRDLSNIINNNNNNNKDNYFKLGEKNYFNFNDRYCNCLKNRLHNFFKHIKDKDEKEDKTELIEFFNKFVKDTVHSENVLSVLTQDRNIKSNIINVIEELKKENKKKTNTKNKKNKKYYYDFIDNDENEDEDYRYNESIIYDDENKYYYAEKSYIHYINKIYNRCKEIVKNLCQTNQEKAYQTFKKMLESVEFKEKTMKITRKITRLKGFVEEVEEVEEKNR